jgi:hypothetical protein
MRGFKAELVWLEVRNQLPNNMEFPIASDNCSSLFYFLEKLIIDF